MKKILALCLLFAIILLCTCPMAYADAAEAAAIDHGCSTLQAKMPLGGSEQLTESAKAVLLYELNTDTLVYTWNADGRLDPSGMVKIMTALVALEYGNLEEMVTVKRSTLNTVAIGAVSANLKSGEEISVRDLLYCVMVSSANDAAAVLAEHVAGTQEDFVALMNQKALELGCTGTNFTNVHGLNTTGQYSTARDLAIITEAALENPLFSEMFSLDSYTVAATNKSDERYIITTNYMMSDEYIKKYYDSRVTGGKTAAASLTDRSIICTAEVGTSRYLCVVMSAQAEVTEDGYTVLRFGSFDEAAVALNYGFDNFAVRQVVDTRQIFAQYGISNGENDVTVSTTADLFTVLPVDFVQEKLIFTDVIDAELLQAPVEKGDVLGTLQISYDGIVLGCCDLKANHSVAVSGTTIQNAPLVEPEQEEPFNYRGLFLLLGLALVVILLILALVKVSIQLVQGFKIRQQHRRRMRNRRRSR